MYKTTRHALTISIQPHWRDHHVDGQAVLPAVEAMELLACAAKKGTVWDPLPTLEGASFDKFLPLPQGSDSIQGFYDLIEHGNGSVTATLLTKTQIKNSPMTRVKTHARVTFSAAPISLPRRPLDVAASLEGPSYRLSPQEIYRQRVPFGSAFRNIISLTLTEEGALAAIQAPGGMPEDESSGMNPLLGSPFPMDAALHAACCWGQQFAGFTAFPFEFESRSILQPTVPRKSYICRIYALTRTDQALTFDMDLYDGAGRLCEVLTKVAMGKVTRGITSQPDDFGNTGEPPSLEQIRSRCQGMVVMDLESVAPFAPRALSSVEAQRFQGMGKRRQRSYLGARLACKRLARKLSSPQEAIRADTRKATDIHTVHADGVRPLCPTFMGPDKGDCAVAHDRRFVVAIATSTPGGIDVESLTSRALKSATLYMNIRERDIVEQSTPDQAESAIRIWTIKEATAKALNVDLAEAWARVEVQSVGPYSSRYRLDGRSRHTAYHDTLLDHLFTLVLME